MREKRWLLCFLVAMCCTFSAWALPSQDKTVTLKLHNVSIETVLDAVKKQTGVNMLYNSQMFKGVPPVSIDAKNEKWEIALKLILNPQGFDYVVKDGIVVIRKMQAEKRENRIRGMVVDSNREPIPGASIIVKGTRTGTSTNIEGEFTLDVRDDKVALEISFIGMKTKEVNYAGQKELDVVLEEELSEMDEVVVTGYQKIERRKLTSSITTVDMETLKTVNQPNIDKLLQGQVPGMTIMSTSGAPGAVPQIRIRGTSTISGNVQPLWVVDGVILDDPVDATVDDILTNRNLIASGIGGVNVDDIESISVLKDAAATAIYGTRAANGVIVITSKKGNVGKTRITYNGSVHVGMRPELKDAYMMNSKERIDVNMEMIQKRSVEYFFC